MQAIIQSVFLQALAQSLLASIWQMALLWLFCLVTMKLFSLSSSQKFNIAFAAQVTGLIWFFYTFRQAYNHPPASFSSVTFTNTILYNINSVVFTCMPYLGVVYLVALLFKLNRFGYIYIASKKLKQNKLIKMPVENRLFVQRMTETLSIHKKVNIYLSEKINCPLTIGFFKPIILIPLAAINQLTPQQMEAVILHELAHIKRADYLLYILQSIADKIFFFNIFSIMLSNIIERERENACDDWVMQFRYNSMIYAEALFKLGRLKAVPVLAMPLLGKKESLLLARVKRLLHNNTSNKNFYNTGAIGFSFSSMAIVGVICLLTHFTPAPAGEASMPVVTVPSFVHTTAGFQDKGNINIARPVAAIYTTTPSLVKQPGKKMVKDETTCNKSKGYEAATVAAADRLEQLNAASKKLIDAEAMYQAKQNYLVQVQQQIDSLQITLPRIEQAVNAQVVVTPEMVQKALSYNNFKQIEKMLAVSSDSIKVIESTDTKNSYKKQITVQSKDKNGNTHVYNVVISLYQ